MFISFWLMFWGPEEKHTMLSGSWNEANVMKFCQLKLKRKMLGRFQDTANCGETSKIYGQEWIHQWEIFFLDEGSVYTQQRLRRVLFEKWLSYASIRM